MANVYELKNTFNTLWNIIEDETADDEVRFRPDPA